MAEARTLHVGQSRLVERAAALPGPFVIWDVGLGAAANAVAVLESFAGSGHGMPVELHSFDRTRAPIEFATAHADELGYLSPWLGAIEELLATGAARAGAVHWRFHEADFCEFIGNPAAPAPHAILYDPYSPAANPEMWTLEHFTRLRRILDPARPCTLSSYSRSTAVRVTLCLAGFFAGYGGAIGEKDQTTMAATHRDLLSNPLTADWLVRVRRSTRGSPLRDGQQPGPVSDEDFAALSAMLAR